ncbi:hypothetical protein NBZ79_03800 [Sneathiella marina]|uniref:Uncharacterized protein n=1 Tax=Sneathiella marina TaxID=2950108 RepID=A0ABY4W4H5_9PROT|nr:hypothetical protein [Sneathiella marina]USG62097.1 hypothetical protein NBZ79_03800 [Sneathiella marina]
MFRIVIFFSVLMSVLNEIYLTYAKELEAPKADKKANLDAFYRQICMDIDMSDFNIANRPADMKVKYDPGLQIIIPDCCVPYVEGKIPEDCGHAISLLDAKYSKDKTKISELRVQTWAAINQLRSDSSIMEPIDKLEISDKRKEIFKEKIRYRNQIFIYFIYSQLNKLGSCGSIAANVVQIFAQKDITKQRMILVSVVGPKTPLPEDNIFNYDIRSSQEHAFFVLGSKIPEGTYANTDLVDGKVPENMLDGWICDPWRLEPRFGTVRDLVKNDPVYSLSSWKSYEVNEVDLPVLSPDEDEDDFWFEECDFMTSPELFTDLILKNEKLWKNMIISGSGKISKRNMRKKIRSVLLPAEDSDAVHSEL